MKTKNGMYGRPIVLSLAIVFILLGAGVCSGDDASETRRLQNDAAQSIQFGPRWVANTIFNEDNHHNAVETMKKKTDIEERSTIKADETSREDGDPQLPLRKKVSVSAPANPNDACRINIPGFPDAEMMDRLAREARERGVITLALSDNEHIVNAWNEGGRAYFNVTDKGGNIIGRGTSRLLSFEGYEKSELLDASSGMYVTDIIDSGNGEFTLVTNSYVYRMSGDSYVYDGYQEWTAFEIDLDHRYLASYTIAYNSYAYYDFNTGRYSYSMLNFEPTGDGGEYFMNMGEGINSIWAETPNSSKPVIMNDKPNLSFDNLTDSYRIGLSAPLIKKYGSAYKGMGWVEAIDSLSHDKLYEKMLSMGDKNAEDAINYGVSKDVKQDNPLAGDVEDAGALYATMKSPRDKRGLPELEEYRAGAVEIINDGNQNIDKDALKEFEAAIDLVKRYESAKELFRGVDLDALKAAFKDLLDLRAEVYGDFKERVQDYYDTFAKALTDNQNTWWNKPDILPDEYFKGDKIAMVEFAISRLKNAPLGLSEKSEALLKTETDLKAKILFPATKDYRKNIEAALISFTEKTNRILKNVQSARVKEGDSEIQAVFVFPQK